MSTSNLEVFNHIPLDYKEPVPQHENNGLENLALVTRCLPPEGVSGEVIGFTPLSCGVLREDYRHSNDYSIHFTAFPEWSFEEIEKAHEQQPLPIMLTSRAGTELIDRVGLLAVRELMIKPETAGGAVIGEGSESIARRLEFADRDLVVKYTNDAGIAELQTSYGRLLRTNFARPNYLYKFGGTETINKVLRDLPLQPNNFVYAGKQDEYFASMNVLVEDYVAGESLAKIVLKATRPNDFKDRVADFQGQTPEYWLEWLKDFDAYVETVNTLFFIAKCEQNHNNKSFPFDKLDTSYGNWVVQGIDPRSGHPKLALIDQSPAPITVDSTAWLVHGIDDQWRYEELSKIYANDPTLAFLRTLNGPASNYSV